MYGIVAVFESEFYGVVLFIFGAFFFLFTEEDVWLFFFFVLVVSFGVGVSRFFVSMDRHQSGFYSMCIVQGRMITTGVFHSLIVVSSKMASVGSRLRDLSTI